MQANRRTAEWGERHDRMVIESEYDQWSRQMVRRPYAIVKKGGAAGESAASSSPSPLPPVEAEKSSLLVAAKAKMALLQQEQMALAAQREDRERKFKRQERQRVKDVIGLEALRATTLGQAASRRRHDIQHNVLEQELQQLPAIEEARRARAVLYRRSVMGTLSPGPGSLQGSPWSH